jgi:hypothetical protein
VKCDCEDCLVEDCDCVCIVCIEDGCKCECHKSPNMEEIIRIR